MLSVNLLFRSQKKHSPLTRRFLALLLVVIGSMLSINAVNAQIQIERGREPMSIQANTTNNSDGQITNARDFVEKYPYETSRLTFICSRVGHGKVSFGFIESGGQYSHEFVVQEYFRTNHQLPEDDIDDWIGIKGAGVRVIIDVRSLEGKVAINSLFGLGADADAKKITGTISIQVMGMGGRVVTNAMSVPINLSSESISNALQTIQTLKSRIFEAADKDLNNQVRAIPEIDIIPSEINSPKLSKDCPN